MTKTNAERQAAFRARLKERLEDRPPIAPAPPSISNIPAQRRWTALQKQAQQLLIQARDEMQAYYNDRSEQWQESERGEEMSNRITELEDLITSLEPT